jgi:MFS family permease
MKGRDRALVTTLGLGQILSWGTSFYLIAVLAGPVSRDLNWPLAWLVAGQSLALVVAGVASPYVGRWIERSGGRVVLAASSVLLAAAHVLIATSSNIALWYVAYFIFGLAMACGLYDAAFSTLGQIFGASARRSITNITLFGGLASTICWPLTAFMVENIGWRGACLVYAAIHIGIMLPLHWRILPPLASGADKAGIVAQKTAPEMAPSRSLYLLLSIMLTTAASIASVISVHLIAILEARSLDLVMAVALGAIFGPAQVSARIVELALGRHYHPAWTLVASVLLVCLGIALLGLDGPFALIALALVFYGAGNGIYSIAKGTVPLALFGPHDYARLMGRLAFPALLAQAAAPPIVALVIEAHGAGMALNGLALVALLNCGAAIALLALTRAHRRDVI